jgi:tRNA pseudouridine38-40 synthase
MVRILVGTALDVGRGRRTLDDVRVALDTGDRTRAGLTAPAHGLWLVRVDY